MARRAPALQPIHPTLKPPQGARPAGLTPDGKQLYEMVEVRASIVDKVNPETGEVEHRKNTITGEQLHKLREVEKDEQGRPVRVRNTRLFYLHSEGNGNVRKVTYTPPSEEDLKKAERRQRVQEMQEALAEGLVDAGMSPQDAIARLRGEADAGPGLPPPETPEPVSEVPPPENGDGDTAPEHPVWGVSVRDMDSALAEIEDPAALANYLEAEALNPDHEGGRSTVLKKIRDRLADVEGGEDALAAVDARAEARQAADDTPEL
jgi:hypothetical protein